MIQSVDYSMYCGYDYDSISSYILFLKLQGNMHGNEQSSMTAVGTWVAIEL